MGDKKPLPLMFPSRGLDENWAYQKQADQTAPDALNVRTYEALKQRARGGQRSGLSKYVTAAINGSSAIQAISQLTTAFDSSTIVPSTTLFATTFTQADGVLSDATNWYNFKANTTTQGSDASAIQLLNTGSVTVPYVVSGVVQAQSAQVNYAHAGMLKLITNPGSTYVMRASVKITMNAGSTQSFAFIFRATDPAANLAAGTYLRAGIERAAAGTRQAFIMYGPNAGDYVVTAMGTAQGYPDAFWLAYHTWDVRVSGDLIRLYCDDVLIKSVTTTRLNTQTYCGFDVFVSTAANGTEVDVTDFTIATAVTPLSLRTTRLVAVSGGTLYAGSKTAGLVAPIGASAAFKTVGRVGLQQAYGKMYACDGIVADYKIYDPIISQVVTWTATPLAWVTAHNYTKGDEVTVGGSEYLALTSHLSGASHATPPGNTTDWQVQPTNGSLPHGTLDATVACRIIALYRGRIVLSGLAEDPQNWFMSKVGDPLNWNYTPTVPNATMAVAGNNSDAGLMGDVITALMPYNDDLLFMGGDHTLWVMRGDPAAGGMIDNISYQTGVVGPDAWTRDPQGNLYFFGAGTLWRMASGQWVPEPMSRGRMDKTFGAIDYTLYAVRLVWDTAVHGLRIYFTPANQPAAGSEPIMWFWDQRSDSFWRDQYPAAVGPTATWLYDADLPTDRALLLGGFDSYIRQIDATAKDDDGTAIHSYVKYPPALVGGDMGTGRLSEIVPIIAQTSDPVTLRVFAGSNAEEASLSTSILVGRELKAGRNASFKQRVNGNAIIVQLESGPAWTTTTVYPVGTYVLSSGLPYVCAVAHQSGTFATDLAAGKWTLSTARTWAIEGMTGVLEISGKARHGRL